MKKHFISLFDKTHLKRTTYLFIIAVSLIIISSLVGISDNLPMIAMLLSGIIILFFSVLHPWKKAGNYAILAGLCIGILLLEGLGITILAKMHKDEYLSEGIAMGVAFLVCVPGIIVGIIGTIICAAIKK
jgi:predicted lysophospholipase L1 biosynthesis ABC-type transport system permease subunit